MIYEPDNQPAAPLPPQALKDEPQPSRPPATRPTDLRLKVGEEDSISAAYRRMQTMATRRRRDALTRWAASGLIGGVLGFFILPFILTIVGNMIGMTGTTLRLILAGWAAVLLLINLVTLIRHRTSDDPKMTLGISIAGLLVNAIALYTILSIMFSPNCDWICQMYVKR